MEVNEENHMPRTGRPPKDTDTLTLRMPSEIFRALDQRRKEEDDLPNRQEMIRRILIRELELGDGEDG